jgi:hypothetical protein
MGVVVDQILVVLSVMSVCITQSVKVFSDAAWVDGGMRATPDCSCCPLSWDHCAQCSSAPASCDADMNSNEWDISANLAAPLELSARPVRNVKAPKWLQAYHVY